VVYDPLFHCRRNGRYRTEKLGHAIKAHLEPSSTVRTIPDADDEELYEDSRRRFEGTNGDSDGGESTLDMEALLCFSDGTENDFARRSYEWHRAIGDAVTSPVLAGRSATGIKLTATNTHTHVQQMEMK